MSYSMIVVIALLPAFCALGAAADEPGKSDAPSIRVGVFSQEVAAFYGEADGLPSADVYAVAVLERNGVATVYAGTAKGLCRFSDGAWQTIPGLPQAPVTHLAQVDNEFVCWLCEGAIYTSDSLVAAEKLPVMALPEGVEPLCLAASDMGLVVGTDHGLYRQDAKSKALVPVAALNDLLGENKAVLDVVWCPGITVAAASGLYVAKEGGLNGPWESLEPRTEGRGWSLFDVTGLARAPETTLWFACPQGVGRRDREGGWSLYTPYEGLPYDDFTCVAAGGDGAVWFGTTWGAIRLDGPPAGVAWHEPWSYRQGRRWLPDDHVRDIAVTQNGDAWFATAKGVGVIRRVPMTLEEKAAFYEDEIDKYHRRTEFGYVLEAGLEKPGDKGKWTNSDSDNDGLWTAMYGAGECFAYAATKDPKAKKRAKDAFEALRFLCVVTQGGDPPALPGFVARSILPTDGWNPNEEHYTREKDLHTKLHGDALWKVIHPRWPTSADGKWYWKCDTSSDELDGHYFFYGVYCDLVADTDDEKQRVREVVAGLTDHLVEHDFNLVDWDGKPTRWAIYSPKDLNNNPAWFPERGLNSLSILSYLAVAHHVTGDQKYANAFTTLVNDHGYAMNLMYPKLQFGPGSNNQSDDEMAFMSYYSLVRYAPNLVVKAMTGFSFKQYWTLEKYELNPLFNFMYASVSMGGTFKDPWGMFDLNPEGPWLEQSIDTLKRFPLDRCNWAHQNSHRKDLLPLPDYRREDGAPGKGYRRNGYCLPVDERHFNHWNTDPWNLDYGGDGRALADGAVFLLPYYMGLYHGFIEE